MKSHTAFVLDIRQNIKGGYIVAYYQRGHTQSVTAHLTEDTLRSSTLVPLFSYKLTFTKSIVGLSISIADEIPRTPHETWIALKALLNDENARLSRRLFKMPQLKDIDLDDTDALNTLMLISDRPLCEWAISIWNRHLLLAKAIKKLASIGCSYKNCRHYCDIHGDKSMYMIASRPQTVLPFLNNDCAEKFLLQSENNEHEGSLSLLSEFLKHAINGRTVIRRSEIPPKLLDSISFCVDENWVIVHNDHLQLSSVGVIENIIRDFLTKHSRAFHPRYSKHEVHQALDRWKWLAYCHITLLDPETYSDLLNNKIIMWMMLSHRTIALSIESYLAIHKIVVKTPVRIVALSEHIYNDSSLKKCSIPISRATEPAPSNYSTSIIIGAEAASTHQLHQLFESLTPNTQIIFMVSTSPHILRGSPLYHLIKYYPNTFLPNNNSTTFERSASIPINDILSKLTPSIDEPYVTDNYELSRLINDSHKNEKGDKILVISGEPFNKGAMVKIEFTSGKLKGSLLHGKLCSVSKKGVLIDHFGQFHLIPEHDALEAKWSLGYSVHIANIPRLRLKKFKILLSEKTTDQMTLQYVQNLIIEQQGSSIQWYEPSDFVSETYPRCQRITPIIE